MVPVSQLVVHLSNNFWVQLVGSDRSQRVHGEGKKKEGGKVGKLRQSRKDAEEKSKQGNFRRGGGHLFLLQLLRLHLLKRPTCTTGRLFPALDSRAGGGTAGIPVWQESGRPFTRSGA